MKKIKVFSRNFSLKVSTYANFEAIKQYLMQKYTVYTAIFKNNIAYFRITYSF